MNGGSWSFGRAASAVVALLFFAAIWTPLAASFRSYDPYAADLEEYRPPSPWPRLARRDAEHTDPLRDYVQGLEDYWNDRFGFRRSLIWAHSKILVERLHVSSSDQVILGKHGWLFYTGEDLGDIYRVVHPFTREELAFYGQYLEDRARWLSDRGCRFLLVLVPEKQTIYPEELPPQVVRLHERSRLDQLAGELRSRRSVEVIDLRPALWRAKNDGIVYLKLDTHWNDVGAFHGYRAIADWMAGRWPAVDPCSLADFAAPVDTGTREGRRSIPKGILYAFRHPDLPRLLGLPMSEEPVILFPQYASRAFPAMPPRSKPWRTVPGRMGPTAYETGDPSLPRGLLYHDSFAKMFIPTLSEHFQRLACIQGGYYDFDPDLVLREKPDVVILEVAERYLGAPAFR